MTWAIDLLQYRRDKAAESLEAARILVEKEQWSSAVNRIYYALFYEVVALLMTKNLSSPKHSGVRGLFNKLFVKPGLVDLNIGRFFNRMFDFRQKGDYEDFVYFEEEDVKMWFADAQTYIAQLEKYIDNEIKQNN